MAYRIKRKEAPLIGVKRILAEQIAAAFASLPIPEPAAASLALIAGIGHAGFGNVNWELLINLLMGSLPGIYIGSRLSGTIPDKALLLGLRGQALALQGLFEFQRADYALLHQDLAELPLKIENLLNEHAKEEGPAPDGTGPSDETN